MKTKIVRNTEFNPITLEITIESKEELCSLWHRFNNNNFDEYNSTDLRYDKVSCAYDVWEALDVEVKRLDLYK